MDSLLLPVLIFLSCKWWRLNSVSLGTTFVGVYQVLPGPPIRNANNALENFKTIIGNFLATRNQEHVFQTGVNSCKTLLGVGLSRKTTRSGFVPIIEINLNYCNHKRDIYYKYATVAHETQGHKVQRDFTRAGPRSLGYSVQPSILTDMEWSARILEQVLPPLHPNLLLWELGAPRAVAACN